MFENILKRRLSEENVVMFLVLLRTYTKVFIFGNILEKEVYVWKNVLFEQATKNYLPTQKVCSFPLLL